MKSLLLLPLLLLLLAGCQSANNKEVTAALSDSTSVFGVTGDSLKLIKTAAVQLKVHNVEESTKALSSLTQFFGGMIFTRQFQSVEENRKEVKISVDSTLVLTAISPRADVVIRLPSQHLDSFLFAVADLGYFTASSNLQIDDRSLLYLENALKQQARKAVLTRPSSTQNLTVASRQQVLELKDDIIEQSIANRKLDADAAYSTISLNLFQNAIVRREVVANTALMEFELPFGQRVANAIEGGWSMAQTFLLALLQLWTFLLFGLTAWIAYRIYQSKGKPAQLAKN